MNHSDHQTLDYEIALSETVAEIKSKQNQLKRFVSQLHDEQRHLKRSEERLKTIKQDKQALVRTAFQEIRFQVNLREQELIDQVDKMSKDLTEEVFERKGEVKDKYEKT